MHAQASAQIVLLEPEVKAFELLPQAVVSPAGLLLIGVGERSVGTVVIWIAPASASAATPASVRGPEKRAETGSVGAVSAEKATQNVRQSDGTLSGDIVVDVAIPAPSSGALAAQGQASTHVTIQFN